MTSTPVVLAVIGGYVWLLFGIALRSERRGVRRSGLIYTLSLGVYCTSWTFYGSVGRAAHSGVDFLPIYLGPTLVFCLGGSLLARMIRVSKASRITSIADFVSTRYGRSAWLAGLVTLVMLAGSVPYIALQLQAVAESLTLLLPPARSGLTTGDVALATAVLLGVFAILFGARHTDLSAHRPGLVAAIAFDLVVKLVCLTAVGLFVGLVLFDGFADLFARAAARADLADLTRFAVPPADWTALLLLSMAAAFCLPRQFHMIVVENRRETDLAHAIWGFPLYLLLINLFVLPIALAGVLLLPAGTNADMIVLDLPLSAGASWLAVLAFVGGVSAATGMVAVETLALGTMVSNDLVMPALLRLLPGRMAGIPDLTRLLLGVRRASIVLLLLLGLLYTWVVGGSYALVSIGLVSFAAAAQLAPAIVVGMFWSGARAAAAGAGIAAGTVVWAVHPVPALARPLRPATGWVSGCRPVWAGMDAAVRAVRPWRARSDHAHIVLVHAGEFRPADRGLGLASSVPIAACPCGGLHRNLVRPRRTHPGGTRGCILTRGTGWAGGEVHRPGASGGRIRPVRTRAWCRSRHRHRRSGDCPSCGAAACRRHRWRIGACGGGIRRARGATWGRGTDADPR